MAYDHREAADATVTPMTEEDLADQLVAAGARVRKVRGRHWVERGWGFFEPVHVLHQMRHEEIRRPGMCWGFRAALRDEDARHANGSIPYHVMDDLAAYGWHSLPKDSRRYLSKFDRHGIRIVWVTDPAVFRDQGYELFMEWRQRVIDDRLEPTREWYLDLMTRRTQAKGWLTLAGMRGDRLLGYMTAWVVDDTAHLQDSKIATEALPTRLGVALDHEALLILQRSGAVRRAAAGYHTPQSKTLTEYKVRQGFAITQIPARVEMVTAAAAYMRWRHPEKFYRLAGTSAERLTGSTRSAGA